MRAVAPAIWIRGDASRRDRHVGAIIYNILDQFCSLSAGCAIKTANLSIYPSIYLDCKTCPSDAGALSLRRIFSRARARERPIRANTVTETRRRRTAPKSFPTARDTRRRARGVPRRVFTRGREAYLHRPPAGERARARARPVELVESRRVYSRVRRNHIDCRQERPRHLWGLLSLFRFRLLHRRRSLLQSSPPDGRSRVFLYPSTLSPPAPTPYDEAVRSLQRSVFTNFISFL